MIRKTLLLLFCLGCWQTVLTVCVAAQTSIGLTVYPTAATVPVSGERQITAQVTGTTNQAVGWSVNGIAGGNASVGTIDANGKYVAPAMIPPNSSVTVKATSAANSAVSANCIFTIRNQIPYLTAVSPNPLALGNFTLNVTGSRFVAGAQVFFNNQPLVTSFVSTTQLTATGNAAQAGNASVYVANPGGNGAVSTNLTVNVATIIGVTVSPANANLQVGGTQQFQANVTNSANQAVVWKVNNVAGGSAGTGTIDASGLYTAPPVLPVAGAVSVSATSVADGITKATASVGLNDPQTLTVNRFLDQSTFGATSALTAHVKQIGFQNFIDEQFALPESVYPPIATATRWQVQDRFWINAFKGNDQLRQRVVYGLSQIWVTALNKNVNADQTIPWLQILSRNSFGNYRTLMKEMTLDASMGAYLDLVNSNKPSANYAPNENFAREVMQLFTIGLYEMNQDGTYKLDVFGKPIPSYDQTTVRQLALALTGWTFPTTPGQTPRANNSSYYTGQMEPRQGNHDTTAKTLFGQTLPANQTIQQDLDGALDIIFNHPNLAPFVSLRLIRSLVTSNPSPAYVGRVAAVFENNGTGVRGDMQAVIRAILMDTEARNDTPDAAFGRLRSPMQHTIGLFRALGANFNEPLSFLYIYDSFGESILNAPSVFGHYSPLYRLPSGAPAPEFQIYTPTETVNRANFIYQILGAYSNGAVDLTPFMNIAADPVQLVSAIDNRLLYGRMSQSTRTSIYKALQATSDPKTRVLTVLYLVATSGEYVVQR